MCFQEHGFNEIVNAINDIDAMPDVAENVRWASCVGRPGKVICISLNYSDHAAESGMAIPKEPIVFQKGANTVVGPYDNIIIPRNSVKTDLEAELGIFIGRDARYLSASEAAEENIAGYCVSHDVSERAFQLERGGQWTKGKLCDSFSPLGPYLVPKEEISDVRKLSMSLSVNGEQNRLVPPRP
jgi:2,4-diketo-3-deoxy-L-fuconate hydrolase